ncbi:baculoviral IAP repeat-containing protein 3-like [Gigantopelta aegis]|uniref:baculoviral IAP repeat-containing protein 3-like n=1 Tax=Gigantopelta aegis TaxID=1735272 RepID=UPI001B88E49E|nr:baculoviral IAP repeat-containing protein 3-like [Gigantopelta aegis]
MGQTVSECKSASLKADHIAQRHDTFAEWKGKKNSIQLAIAGFQYTGTGDKVVCPTCKLKLYNWLGSEDAVELHRSRSPDCAFIQKWFSRHGQQTVSDATAEKSLDCLKPPKHPAFRDYQKRLKSYVGWPLKLEQQSPSRMADEGFFYVGFKDRASCFHCGLTLVDWDYDDVPLEVHVTYSPECEFAQDRTKMLQGSLEKPNTPSTTSCTETNSQSHVEKGLCNGSDSQSSSVQGAAGAVGGASGVSGEKSGNHGDVSKTTRYSPIVQAVMEFGYSIDEIERVVREEKRRSGKDFPDAPALFRALSDEPGV